MNLQYFLQLLSRIIKCFPKLNQFSSIESNLRYLIAFPLLFEFLGIASLLRKSKIVATILCMLTFLEMSYLINYGILVHQKMKKCISKSGKFQIKKTNLHDVEKIMNNKDIFIQQSTILVNFVDFLLNIVHVLSLSFVLQKCI